MTSGEKKKSRNKISNEKYSLRKINRSRCAKFVNCEKMTFHPPTLLDVGPGVGVCGVGGKKPLQVLKIFCKIVTCDIQMLHDRTMLTHDGECLVVANSMKNHIS